MALVKSTRKEWQKPPTSIYERNYGYGMNFYQPMIDYLDNKKVKEKVDYPHLPYTNERGLDKYSPRNVIKSYSQADLQRFTSEAQSKPLDEFSRLRINRDSKYSLQKTVSAAAVERVRVEAVVKKSKKKKSKSQKESTTTMHQYDYDPDADKQAEWALRKIKKFLRGKSAYAIEQMLLKESAANISDTSMNDRQSFQSSGTQRFRVHETSAHAKMMDSRMTEQLNRSFMEPLDNLRVDLKGFDRKTAINMESQRWKVV